MELKIAFARINDDIGLSIDLNKGQGVEHRRGMLHALVEAGHKVTLVTPVRSREEGLLQSNTLSEDTSWYKKLSYNINANGADFDIFILECGSQNTRFSRDINGETLWNVKLSLDKLRQFKGKVLFWHHIYANTALLPFGAIGRAGDLTTEKKDSLSELNWVRLLGDWDLFDGREWTVLHHALNEDEFKKVRTGFSKYTACYGEVPKLHYRYLHMPQSVLDPIYPVNESPKYDSLYIGSRYSHSVVRPDYDRLANLKKFYDTPLYHGALVGYFDHGAGGRPNTNGHFAHASNFQVDGWIPTAVSTWNDSLTHIFTESELPLKVGAITGRTFLSLRGGSILLLDHSISNVYKLNLKEFEVSSAEEASSKISYYRSCSPAVRNSIRQEQLATFPYWTDLDWSSILN